MSIYYDNYDRKNLESIDKALQAENQYLEKSYRMIQNESAKEKSEPKITKESRRKCAQALIG